MLRQKRYYITKYCLVTKLMRYKLIVLQNAASALDFYDKNFVKALQHLFPELQFDETKFKRMPSISWFTIYFICSDI